MVDTSPDAPSPTDPPPSSSLTGVRVAAAFGVIVNVVLVVLGFSVSWWLGLLAVALLPVVPAAFVSAFEAIRR